MSSLVDSPVSPSEATYSGSSRSTTDPVTIGMEAVEHALDKSHASQVAKISRTGRTISTSIICIPPAPVDPPNYPFVTLKMMTIILEATVRKFTGEATADQKEAAAARKEVTAAAALFAERMTANTTAARNDTAAAIETAIEKVQQRPRWQQSKAIPYSVQM